MYDNGNHSATPFGISMGSSFVSQMHSHKNTGTGLGLGARSLSMYNGVSAYESLNGSVSVGSVAVSECESRTIGRNGSGNTLESDIHSQNHDTIYNDNHIRDIILNDNRDDDILIHHDITYQSTNNFYDNIGGNINSNIAGNTDNSGIITTPGPLSGSVPVVPDKNIPSNQYALDSNRINSRNDIAVVVNNDHNSCYVGEGVLSVFKGMYDHTVSTAVSTDAHNTRALHTAADSPLAVSPHLAPPHRHSFCDFLSSTFSDFKFDRSAENVLTDHAHIQPPRKGSRPVYSEWDGDLTDMKFLLVDDSSMIRKVSHVHYDHSTSSLYVIP